MTWHRIPAATENRDSLTTTSCEQKYGSTSASATASSAPGCRCPGSGSPCGWKARSPMSWPAVSWSALSPARSQPRAGRGCGEPGPGPPGLPEPLVVTWRVSVRGSVMVGGQRIQIGLAHAGKTVQVSVGPDTYEVAVEPGISVTAARTSSRDIRRHIALPTSPRSGRCHDRRAPRECRSNAAIRKEFYSFNYTTVFVISHFRLAVELAELIR
jgi:hypothetical protein